MEEKQKQSQQSKTKISANPSIYKRYKLEKIQSMAFKKEDYNLGMEEKTQIEDKKNTVHVNKQNPMSSSLTQYSFPQITEDPDYQNQILVTDLNSQKKGLNQLNIQNQMNVDYVQSLKKHLEYEDEIFQNEESDQEEKVIMVQNNQIRKFNIENHSPQSENSFEVSSDSED